MKESDEACAMAERMRFRYDPLLNSPVRLNAKHASVSGTIIMLMACVSVIYSLLPLG